MQCILIIFHSLLPPLTPPRSITPTLHPLVFIKGLLSCHIALDTWPSLGYGWPTRILTLSMLACYVRNKVFKMHHFHFRDALVPVGIWTVVQILAFFLTGLRAGPNTSIQTRCNFWNGGILVLIPSLVHDALQFLTSEEFSILPKKTSDIGLLWNSLGYCFKRWHTDFMEGCL